MTGGGVREQALSSARCLHLRSTFRLRGLGGMVLREFRLAGGVWSWHRDYIHRGGQLLAQVQPGADGLRFAHLDHLGTPRLYTDAGGIARESRKHYPYGEILAATTPGSSDFVMAFTGHERDDNGVGTTDDLDYMHARYYSPLNGRFLVMDRGASANPQMPQSWNKYSYALGNPLKYVDPDGNVIETAWDVANIALGLSSLVRNIASGNVVGAIVDAGGLVVDGLATAVPVVPGGAGAAIKGTRAAKAAQLAANKKFGDAFEKAVLKAIKIDKNKEVVDSATGLARYRIPDGKIGDTLIEVKGVQRLGLTPQVRDFVAAATKDGGRVIIVVPSNVKISERLNEFLQEKSIVIVRLDIVKLN